MYNQFFKGGNIMIKYDKKTQKILTLNLKDCPSAIEFIEITNSYQSNFDVIQNRTDVDGKSILGVLSLDLSKDIQLIMDKEIDEKAFEKFIKK